MILNERLCFRLLCLRFVISMLLFIGIVLDIAARAHGGLLLHS